MDYVSERASELPEMTDWPAAMFGPTWLCWRHTSLVINLRNVSFYHLTHLKENTLLSKTTVS